VCKTALEKIRAQRPAVRRQRRRYLRQYMTVYRRGIAPERLRARDAVKRAVAGGLLIRPKRCESCNVRSRVHGHHYAGYARAHWLDVIWLCPLCHKDAHLRGEVDFGADLDIGS
jgi:hypothetical protein